jgi:hypothetical protein
MAVVAAAFVPSAPILVPELAGGAVGELDALRAAADGAVAEVCSVGGGRLPVLVIGRGERATAEDGSLAGTFQPWGVDVRVGDRSGEPSYRLPLSLTVGAWWLDRAEVSLARRTYQGVGPSDPVPQLASDCVLLVVGDGSSTRTPKAPGSYDPRGESWDRALVAALRSGDPAALAHLDAVLACAVLADGVAAWHAAARLMAGRTYAADLRFDEAPYGVDYVVARWD